MTVTIIVGAATSFVAGMLAEALIWRHRTHHQIQALIHHIQDLTADRDRWMHAAQVLQRARRHPVGRHLTAVDE